MSATRSPPQLERQKAERLVTRTSARPRQAPSARRMAMRRVTLVSVKLGLPALALLLLTSIALWPQLASLADRSRVTFRRVFAVDPNSGRMLQPHYRGVDQRGRPYTLTADWANQVEPTRIDMGEPKGDMMTESGNWIMIQGRDGVYMQRTGQLDLSRDVVIYRDDGTVMRTQVAEADVKQGAASSDHMTHAEGPFGVLDAQGFMLTDKGAAIQFQGPAKLIINGGQKQ